MQNRKYFALLLMVLLTPTSHAKEISFIRDYTYKASDLDSKVSARNNTLKLIKAGVLEEIVTYVYNNSSLEQTQAGNQFRSSFIQQTSTSSAGFLKAKVLEERWDGFEMKIKAEVSADPDTIRGELERALALKPTLQAQALKPDIPPTAPKLAPVNTQPNVTQLPPVMPVANTTADYSGYVRSAQVAQVYSLIQPLKITMTQHYMINGEWPSSLKQINLNPEEMTDGQYLDKVRLGRNGQILAYLSDTFGKNKLLSLTPKSIMGGMQTRWDCTTNLNTKGLHGLPNLKCSEDKNLHYY